MKKKKKSVSYDKYGYLFIAPFFIAYLLFQLWPLINTFYYSTLEYYKRNGREVINFVGIQNFLNVFGLASGEKAYVVQYLGNTVTMWVMNFIPQILVSLLLAAWLSNEKVRLRGTGAVKVIIYLPSIITAASVSVLFHALFSQYGPITKTLQNMGIISQTYDFMASTMGTHSLISLILFWMWYGNTTLLLISGIMGIDPGLYEAADIDGAGGWQQFRYLTLPLLKPIMLYVLVTSAIGGLQMYDIPALFNPTSTGLVGLPNDTSTSVTMYIMRLYNSDVGKAATVSVVLFAVTLVISLALFATMGDKEAKRLAKAERRRKK